jgi:hypothetical protein
MARPAVLTPGAEERLAMAKAGWASQLDKLELLPAS